MRPALSLLVTTLSLALMAGACSETSAPPTKDEGPPQAGQPATVAGTSIAFEGQVAPDILLERELGDPGQPLAAIFAENHGKPLLVNLWATWCAPCVAELPSLDRLAADSPHLVVVALSQDMEGWGKVTPFLKERSLPNLQVRLESGMKYGQAVQATGLPVTIFYGADGQEKWRYIGDRAWDSPEARAEITGS